MNILDYLLLHFTRRDIEIYRMRRFEHKTLKEIAKEYGITQPRARELERKLDDKIKELSVNINISVKINN